MPPTPRKRTPRPPAEASEAKPGPPAPSKPAADVERTAEGGPVALGGGGPVEGLFDSSTTVDLSDMKMTLAGGTSDTFTMSTGSQPFASDVTIDQTLSTGEQPFATRVTIDPYTVTVSSGEKPFTTDSKIDAKSDSTVDLKPVAVDSCVRLDLAPLPPTRVRTPYHQRIGFTIFGVEVFGWTLSGVTSTHVEPEGRRPVVYGLADDDRDEHDHGRWVGERRPGDDRSSPAHRTVIDL